MNLKSKISLSVFCFITTFSFAQLRVVGTAGDVGIGIDAPTGKIHVVEVNTDINSQRQPKFWTDSGVASGFHPIADFYRHTPGAGNGGFGAGYVADGADASYTYLYSPGVRDFAMLTHGGVGVGVQTAIYVTAVGNRVGIGGTIAPAHTLHVNGDAGKTTGGDTWTVVSDARLKKNVEKYDKGLNEVLRLNPVTFYYNGKGGTSDKELNVGLIAQDYQKIAPDFVKEYTHIPHKFEGSEKIDDFRGARSVKGQPETYLAMNATPIKYMLVNAIKEQQELILELDKRIEQLEQQLQKTSTKTTTKNN